MGVSLPILGVPLNEGALASPDTVANLKHWYNLESLTRLFQDAAKSTPVTSDSDPVGAWVCQIVAADEISQATDGARLTYKSSVAAFNNKPALQFAGANWLRGAFAAAMTQPTTVFVVAQVTTAADQQLIDGDDATHRNAIFQVSNTWGIFAGSAIQSGTSNTNVHIFVVEFNGASSKLWVDGSLIISSNAGTQVLDGLTVGERYDGAGVRPMTGFQTDVLLYSAILSAADKNIVHNYLAAKYAISVTVFS